MCPSPSPRLSPNRTVLCGGNSISLNVDLMGEAVETSGLRGKICSSVGCPSGCKVEEWATSSQCCQKGERPFPPKARELWMLQDHWKHFPSPISPKHRWSQCIMDSLHRSSSFPASAPGSWTGNLACCSPWGHKVSDTTEQLNWNWVPIEYTCVYLYDLKSSQS